MNGFINFLKFSHHQDDISINTMLFHLSRLISLWKQDNDTLDMGSLEQQDVFYRVSCKLDALMLILLARANGNIRKTAIQILADFYAVTEASSKSKDAFKENGDMPLYAVLRKVEEELPRTACYAFLESYYVGSCLSPQISASLELLSLSDAVSSDFSGLFKFYLGELCCHFIRLGRVKALRHCVKFMKRLVVPFLVKRSSRSIPFLTYSSYLVLLTSLAGTIVLGIKLL